MEPIKQDITEINKSKPKEIPLYKIYKETKKINKILDKLIKDVHFTYLDKLKDNKIINEEQIIQDIKKDYIQKIKNGRKDFILNPISNVNVINPSYELKTEDEKDIKEIEKHNISIDNNYIENNFAEYIKYNFKDRNIYSDSNKYENFINNLINKLNNLNIKCNTSILEKIPYYSYRYFNTLNNECNFNDIQKFGLILSIIKNYLKNGNKNNVYNNLDKYIDKTFVYILKKNLDIIKPEFKKDKFREKNYNLLNINLIIYLLINKNPNNQLSKKLDKVINLITLRIINLFDNVDSIYIILYMLKIGYRDVFREDSDYLFELIDKIKKDKKEIPNDDVFSFNIVSNKTKTINGLRMNELYNNIENFNPNKYKNFIDDNIFKEFKEKLDKKINELYREYWFEKKSYIDNICDVSYKIKNEIDKCLFDFDNYLFNHFYYPLLIHKYLFMDNDVKEDISKLKRLYFIDRYYNFTGKYNNYETKMEYILTLDRFNKDKLIHFSRLADFFIILLYIN